MWKSILLSLLLPFMASVVLAEQQASPATLAANSNSRTDKIDAPVADKTPTKTTGPSAKKDCSNLGYKITLFSPCGDEDSERLWRQTKIVMVAGIGVAGVIALLPEEISKWDKSEYQRGDAFKNWYENVKEGPVWDNDKWYINLIGHPYFGGVYYQAARNSGYNQWNAFTYSALMSTFYWEYGLEAFAEVPSIQDLIVTPVGGWVYGEWAHNKEKSIRANNNLAMGSEFWGSVALFMLDPIGTFDDWCCAGPKVEVTALNIAYWPAQRQSYTVNGAKDYWGVKLSVQF